MEWIHEASTRYGVPFADIPPKYQVPAELRAIYNHYQASKAALNENPNEQNSVNYQNSLNELKERYIHDSLQFWEFWHTERDIRFSNVKP